MTREEWLALDGPRKLDPATMCCTEHGVEWCIVCTCDEMMNFADARKDRRRQLKLEWRETPIHERFDLGGEA